MLAKPLLAMARVVSHFVGDAQRRPASTPGANDWHRGRIEMSKNRDGLKFFHCYQEILLTQRAQRSQRRERRHKAFDFLCALCVLCV